VDHRSAAINLCAWPGKVAVGSIHGDRLGRVFADARVMPPWRTSAIAV
jgi:hypothetical protein